MKSSITSLNYYPNGQDKTYKEATRKLAFKHFIWACYLACLVLSDLFMSLLAFRLAYFIRFRWGLQIFRQNAWDSLPYYSGLGATLVLVWLIIFASVGLYRRQNLLEGTQEYQLVGRATSIGLLTLIIFGFLEPAFIVARGWLVLAWGFSFILVGFGRFVLRRVIYLARHLGYFLSPAIIVGANDEGVTLARQLKNSSASGFDVVGFVDKKLKPGTMLFDDVRVLGRVEDLDEIIRAYGVEEIILASSAISSRDRLLEIFQRYGINSHVNVMMSSGLYEIITTGLTVKEVGYVPFVSVNKVRLTGLDKALKFLLDFSLAIPATIILLPLMFFIAVIIKLDSPGPVIHRRRVVGVRGKPFDAYKFRTMYINGDEILEAYPELRRELDRNRKLKNDPRITRVGRWLRRYSLDELPQLFNVLKGQMSLVGPRMICEDEIKNYDQWGLNLLTVKPGITGLWQVSGRSDVSYQERVRLDMHYIRNWNIWLDLQLIWRTIPAVLKARGAY